MPHALDPITLRLFLAVVEERSMARAAERERITTPAISKRIAELEAQLDVQLLERSNIGVRPTAAGRSLAADARDILAALEAAEGKLTDYARGVRGDVRVSVNPTSMLGTLPDEIRKFANNYPQVRIFIDERRSADIVQAITAGEVNLGVCFNLGDHPDLDVHPWHAVELMLVVPEGHALSGRTSIAFHEAVDNDFVLHPQTAMLGRVVGQAAEQLGIVLRSRVQATTQEAIRRLVSAGMGVAVMTQQSALPYADSHRYRCIALTDDWARLPTRVCTRRGFALPMCVRLLRDALTASVNRS